MFKRIRQYFCSHVFPIDDIIRVDDTKVTCLCRKCGKVCEAHCGLTLPGQLDWNKWKQMDKYFDSHRRLLNATDDWLDTYKNCGRM